MRGPLARHLGDRSVRDDGPLGPYVAGFVEHLRSEGYSAHTVRVKCRAVAGLSERLRRRRLGLDGLSGGRGYVVATAMGARRVAAQMLEFLQAQRVLPPARDPAPDEHRKGPEAEYAVHLRAERGLAEVSIDRYLRLVRPFLTEYRHRVRGWRDLEASDVSRFVLQQARASSPRYAKSRTTALRSFLRFLHARGETAVNLALAVPTVAEWRLATIPRFMPARDVHRLLHACDRRGPTGRREYAVLLLLARLGLRAGEVARITLDDIDWDAGEVLVHGKGPRLDRLPLPDDVGRALAAYVRRDRPRCASRNLFLRTHAPRRGVGPAAVSAIVARVIERCGIVTPSKGAHQLRHSLATSLLERGASLGEIGDLLRHRSPESTAIYAKVDLASLRRVAPPWPGGAR